MIAFRELEAEPDDELARRFHREILAVSFSDDELDDADTFARGLRGDGDVPVLASVAVGQNGAVLGGAVGELYAPEGVLLLSYLAVRPGERGGGIGTRLMEHVAARWYARTDVRLAVAEVHHPRAFAGASGEDPVARLRFFERLGARALELAFVQPALGPDSARVPGFLLLLLHVDPAADSVPSELVARFVRRYYETAEDAQPPYDAELAGLLGQIEAHPTLRVLPLAELDRIPTRR